jgi:ABC-type Fe3+-hydroxamate transport system substrate-binding protein
MMTAEMAIALSGIGTAVIEGAGFIIALQSFKRDAETKSQASISLAAAKDQKHTDDITHLEGDVQRAYDKAQEVAIHMNDRFEKLEIRQQTGDIATAKIAVGVEHILEGIATLTHGQDTLNSKLDEHIIRSQA